MLKNVVEVFFPEAEEYEISQFGNGHINDTYRLDISGSPDDYILQRINTKVFTDPSIIVDAHLRIQQVLDNSPQPLSIPLLIPTAEGKPMHLDKYNNAWRMTSFIKESLTIEIVSENWQAYEAGKGFGWFAKVCKCLDVSEFREPIKDFHRLSFRLRQLNDAIAMNKAGRLDSSRELIDFYKVREAKLSRIEELVDAGKIPLRVVHNDTKINNLLFYKKKASTVIDLDTVGPGIIYYDYGDALRTTGNTSAEDEKDLVRVSFNIDRFEAFTGGYLGQVKNILTDTEKIYLHLAPVLMTYIMGIRFLADYLNGDVYYKISCPEHNADRSRVQKKLIESMESQEEHMKKILKKELTRQTIIS